MKKVQLVLAVGLYTSSLLGIQLLLMDRWLWNASPVHALGLAIFVVIDIALLSVTWKNTHLASLGALLVSLVQLGAMIGDVNSGHPAGVSPDSFRDYLLTNTGFVSLLVVQGIILVASALMVTTSHFHGRRFTILKLAKL
jgi:hypothetical protein